MMATCAAHEHARRVIIVLFYEVTSLPKKKITLTQKRLAQARAYHALAQTQLIHWVFLV